MDEKQKKRIRKPSPAQLRAAAHALENPDRVVDDLTAEALASAAAWIRHEAEKGGAS